MKMMNSLTLITVLIGGCHTDKINSIGNENLTATFIMADTTKHVNTTFHSGEPFLMAFWLINTTTDTITYFFENVDKSVIFEILRNDTVVAMTSYFGSRLVRQYSILPGDTLQGQWRVTDILAPGSYEANVYFPNFYNVKGVNPVNTIAFSITQ